MESKKEEFELKREDIIPPSNLHKEIEDRIFKEVESNDCFVKFDLLGLWILRKVVLDYKEKGIQEGKASAIKIINFYKKSWDEDKDAIFNEGYMENLFNGMLSKLNSQRESSKNEVSVRQNSPPSPLTADSLRGEELKDG